MFPDRLAAPFQVGGALRAPTFRDISGFPQSPDYLLLTRQGTSTTPWFPQPKPTMLDGKRTALLGLLAIAAGCAQSLGPSGRRFPACPGFEVPSMRVTLTPAGDTLLLGDVTLLVPPSSLAHPVEIVISRGSTKRNSAAVAFTPVGTTEVYFQTPATLWISYESCPAADFVRPVVYRVDGGRQERKPTVDSPESRDVRTSLSSLSEYALAVE